MNKNIAIYSDGADIHDMLRMKDKGIVTGFTTNPSLMKKAGVRNYLSFAREVLKAIPELPVSFEVFGDDFATMEKEANELAKLGNNVYVKIPITNTKGELSVGLINKLSSKGIKLNITAILTEKQVIETVDALTDDTTAIVSVFAGRIADTGIDPEPLMKKAVQKCKEKNNVRLLWASTREVYNIIQAEKIGVDIITVPPSLLDKLSMYHMDLETLSLETVKMFNHDVKELGFSILE